MDRILQRERMSQRHVYSRHVRELDPQIEERITRRWPHAGEVDHKRGGACVHHLSIPGCPSVSKESGTFWGLGWGSSKQ
jgi:hypothetical protein